MGLGLFVFHLAVNRQYGFHGDELYFIVCGNRPAWGYVDHPPFVPLMARLATDLMGTNLVALRFFPALALGVSCVLTGWLARRLGAGLFGECLAALCFVFAPLMLRLGAFLNIPCFEVLFWLIAAHLLVNICQRNEPRWWPVIGLLSGFALLNKHTTLFLGVGMAVGLVLTHRRKDLVTPWPWLGGAAAFVIFLPNLFWQYRHDWATLEFVRTINATVMQDTSRVEFMLAQVVLMNVFGAVVWLAGLIFFLRSKAGGTYRFLGWVFLTVLVIMLVFNAKVYYLVPAYPMLMAGGAVLLERWLSGRWGIAVRAALSSAIVIMGLIFLPIVSPIGPLEWKEDYIGQVLGFMLDDPADLTFDFRYQHCRPEELQAFRAVYEKVPAEEQQECVILTNEYDTASEVNVLGRDLGLPKAVSGNNSYYLWGTAGATGECVIAFGYGEDLLRACFQEVTNAGVISCPWRDTSGTGRPLFLCRRPTANLEQLWLRFKVFR
ncbi:MAG: glycosyltransferase family 39 protein [Candidatus Hydrogenedentes bacterium]|nr:glycosyltransferase family 39 protein [Candidatus Hydrogenedentota bacterium]